MSGRPLELARAGYGAVLLLAPGRVLSRLAGTALDRTTVRVARVLGVRHLVQAAALLRHPRWRPAGAAVDAAHAASMVALARWARRPLHRRLAAGNARSAGMLAAAEVAVGLRDAQAGSLGP